MAGEVLMRSRADLGQPRVRHRVAEPVDRLQHPSSRWQGAALTAILASRSSTAALDSAIRSRCSRHGAAPCSVNRPVSAWDRSASFPAVRILPVRSETTESSLIPADSSALASLWI